MTKRLILAFIFAVMAMITAYGVRAQFVTPHNAGGIVNTAVAASDLLYICQPSGTITDPICPIDTAGADETIFVGAEDLLPGSVRWQKLRFRNVGTDPWDIFSVSRSWTEISDPSGLCNTVPEAVIWGYSSGYSSGIEEDLLTMPGGAGSVGDSTLNTLVDGSKNFVALGVQPGYRVDITSGPVQSRTIVGVTASTLTVSPNWLSNPNGSAYVIYRKPASGPGVTSLGHVVPPTEGTAEPMEGVRYTPAFWHDGAVAGSTVFRDIGSPLYYGNQGNNGHTVHVPPGDYSDLLLGIRLPTNTPNDCLNVVWQLNTTWDVQVHFP